MKSLPEFTNCIIAADTHFDSGVRVEPLKSMLHDAVQDDAVVFILGDVVNLWFESRRMVTRYEAQFQLLKRFAERGGKLYFIPGNRDFLAGKVFSRATGMEILPEVADITVNGKVYRLLHGDQIFLGDRNYRIYRVLVRNGPVKWLLRILPDFMLKGVANTLRREPEVPPPEKMAPLDERRFRARIHDADVDTYICGHVHGARTIDLDVDGHAVHIHALSSWVGPKEYAHIDGTGMHVHTITES
jgi:UDP-2,3-diacylglucosamine hydrolase